MGLLERYKDTSSSPPYLSSPRRLLRLTDHHRTAGHLEPRRVWASLSLFLSLLTAILLQGSVKKSAFFLWRFCGVRNASLRRTFCCVVHQKRDFKAHPAASTTLLVGSFQLAADSRLSTHSPSTLDLDSLSAIAQHNKLNYSNNKQCVTQKCHGILLCRPLGAN